MHGALRQDAGLAWPGHRDQRCTLLLWFVTLFGNLDTGDGQFGFQCRRDLEPHTVFGELQQGGYADAAAVAFNAESLRVDCRAIELSQICAPCRDNAAHRPFNLQGTPVRND